MLHLNHRSKRQMEIIRRCDFKSIRRTTIKLQIILEIDKEEAGEMTFVTRGDEDK